VTAAQSAQTAAENAESRASTSASAAEGSANSASAAQTAAESAQTSAGQAATIATQAQSAAAQSAQSAAQAAQSVAASARQIGEIISSALPLNSAGLHLLDGALIDGSGIYADFVSYIGSLYENNPTAAYFTDETTWQSSVTNYGVCGKFVYDETDNTVRLPKLDGAVIEGAVDLTVLGDLDAAGLATSGNDAVKSLFYIVIATVTKTEIQVDIDNIVTDLNSKVDISSPQTITGNKDFTGALQHNGYGVDAVVASGSGYIRYESGLQICWGIVDITNQSTTASGSIYTLGGIVNHSFPVPFVGTPSLSVTNSNQAAFAPYSAGWNGTQLTYVNGYRSTSVSDTKVSFYYIAIGKWK
jgi:hypothetical protein